jgi:hypothetical protein
VPQSTTSSTTYLRRYEHRLEVEGVHFYAWQADDLLRDYGSHLAPMAD